MRSSSGDLLRGGIQAGVTEGVPGNSEQIPVHFNEDLSTLRFFLELFSSVDHGILFGLEGHLFAFLLRGWLNRRQYPNVAVQCRDRNG
jgi:hypothetical protein